MRASRRRSAIAAAVVLATGIAQTSTIVASAFLSPTGSGRGRLSIVSTTPINPELQTVSTGSIGNDAALRQRRSIVQSLSKLYAAAATEEAASPAQRPTPNQPPFSLQTSLFLAGLAFDSYVEPPPNSSRWERGSSGTNVAFLSAAYTRSLYKGIIEITPLRASDLPDEDDAAESLMTGGGIDASLLVSVVEGAWTEDVQKLEKEQFHNGVLDLAGCAHVGRSSTAWSNVDEKKAKRNKTKGGSGAYHIKSSWGRGGQAVWEDDPPFYLYVQDPKTARLVFTLFDEDVVGGGQPIGSSHKKLVELLPGAKTNDVVSMLKSQVIDQLRQSGRLQEAITIQTNPETGEEETIVDQDVILQAINDSYGSGTTASIKMTSKPRKKDKGGQRAMGMAAGAMIAGPAGAAVGGILASMYEGEVRGKVEVELKYTPIPQVDLKLKEREIYKVKGGLPGVEWGELYEKRVAKSLNMLPRSGNGDTEMVPSVDPRLSGDDLEFCCFVTHDSTGCSCAIYRSLERKVIAVSFRGTCAPIDLVTDASIAQDAWVEGEDVELPDTIKVHSGFRKSLNSISRRLKELMLAAVPSGEEFSDYDVLVTGHSLGGSLATCFIMDVAEYGMDAGRGLPQLEPSEAWWNSIASVLGKKVNIGAPPPPPRPKSLKMYNFGSPRVGNDAFCNKFDSLVEGGMIDEAYRIVNDQDVVPRMPRTVNALVLGNIGYDHCGPTVLITELGNQISKHDGEEQISSGVTFQEEELLWIEGQSNDAPCPVRDGNARSNPLGSGSLLGDINNMIKQAEDGGGAEEEKSSFSFAKLGSIAKDVSGRLKQLSAEDVASVVGIDKSFTQREMKLIQSLFSGEGLSHHMEDKYYQGMGMCSGFAALAGQELVALEDLEKMDIGAILESNGSTASG